MVLCLGVLGKVSWEEDGYQHSGRGVTASQSHFFFLSICDALRQAPSTHGADTLGLWPVVHVLVLMPGKTWADTFYEYVKTT